MQFQLLQAFMAGQTSAPAGSPPAAALGSSTAPADSALNQTEVRLHDRLSLTEHSASCWTLTSQCWQLHSLLLSYNQLSGFVLKQHHFKACCSQLGALCNGTGA